MKVEAAVGGQAVVVGVEEGFSAVDGIPPVAADSIDDSQSITPSSIGEGLLDGCEGCAPSGNPDDLLSATVESDTNTQSGSNGQGRSRPHSFPRRILLLLGRRGLRLPSEKCVESSLVRPLSRGNHNLI